LRAKGIDGANGAPGADGTAGLTYTGPDEDGSAQVRRSRDLQPAGATSRRERREAARREGRGPKPPKTRKS
jgi:preprotein translocase subunit SecA